MRVFISHSPRDTALALRLEDQLCGLDASLQVWTDLGREPDRPTESEVAAALRTADLVLVVWTREASRSVRVSGELAQARRHAVALAACVYESAPLPSELNDAVVVEFVGPDRERALAQVDALVGHHLAGGGASRDPSTRIGCAMPR